MLFDFETMAPQDRYKILVSTVVPRPIAWVVTQDLKGQVNAAPFSFFNVVSQDPALVVIGIGGRKPGDAKDTGNNIRETGQFVVNMVSYDNAEAMNVTAIDFEHGVDELAEAGLTTLSSVKIKPPRIAESPVAFECERFMILDINTDRSIVLGKILAAHVRDDSVLNQARRYIDTPKLDLLGRMHGAGGYVRTNAIFDMPRIKVADWTRKS